MSLDSQYNFILYMVFVSRVVCFFPTHGSAKLFDSYTREDITKIGILQALIKHTNGTFEEHGEDENNLKEILKKAIAGSDTVASELEEIVLHNIMVDVHHSGNPVWTFSNEKIMEGHYQLLQLRDRLLQILGAQYPYYSSARETLAEIVYMIQMFYSNTNWVELNTGGIYNNLGLPRTPLYPVAPPSLPVCTICGSMYKQPCHANLMTKRFLTSGYLHTSQLTKTDEHAVDKVAGKCRHGGITNVGNYENFTVAGGINKQTLVPELSEHYFLHQQAARLTMQHILYYLTDSEMGLRALIPELKFLRLFGLDRQTPMLFVDTEEKIKATVLAMLPNTTFQVVKGISLENGSRTRRDLGGLDLYHLIADTSGGSVYETDKTNIAAVVDIIKESVTSKPPITVLKFKQLRNSSNVINIPVDDLIVSLTIKIQCNSGIVPYIELYRPNGSMETFRNKTLASRQALGPQLILIKLYKPTSGVWKINRTASVELGIDVTANTNLDFAYKLMQTVLGAVGEYPLVGRPIAGTNTTVQVTVALIDSVTSLDKLLLLNRNGEVLATYALHNVGGRRGKTMFITYAIIPSDEFEMAVEGLDKSRNMFRRLDPNIVSSLDIKLDVLPLSETLYINDCIDVQYRVTNTHTGDIKIEVNITDDKGFTHSPTTRIHSLSSNAAVGDSFRLYAGHIKGETTTMTITAKKVGAPINMVQYSVHRITVEEKIVRVYDKTPPACNVTSTVGLCDFGTDVCQCSNHSWEMTAAVGDDGDGLQSVFASDAGNASICFTDKFTLGHKLRNGIIHAKLRADCCHQHAKIAVVDLAGNVGMCAVTIAPGIVPPEPKLCANPGSLSSQPLSSGSTAMTNISCNISSIMGNCNGNMSINASGCETQFWTMQADLGSEGIGNLQIVPINACRNASLIRTNNIVELRTDCCYPDVFINVVDIAGNVGQCHCNVNNIQNKQASAVSSNAVTDANKSTTGSSLTSIPIGIIIGGTISGVAAIGGITVLVLYIKKRHTASGVTPDANGISSAQ